jgi:hypothetical protein
MKNSPRRAMARKVAVTVVTAAVAFLCGWSAGNWERGLAMAAALGTAAGIATFRDRPVGPSSCANWRLRHRPGQDGKSV